jgi:NAD(P)-dependent dehydrogenase (short-subunit alcohol dehydrogenase family)
MSVAFVAAGAGVVAVDIRQEALDETVSLLDHATALPVVADAASEEGVQLMLASACRRFGRVDVLCNNAGILDRMAPLHETTDELWEHVLAVNLTGPFRACRAVLPMMLAQGGGVIVNTASISGFLGGRAGTAYTCSKHGVLGLTRAIAATYGGRGIRCNAISPGSVKTNIAVGQEVSGEGLALRQRGLTTRPIQAEPAEIAPVAVFLASDEACYLNGADIVVDAGWTIY